MLTFTMKLEVKGREKASKEEPVAPVEEPGNAPEPPVESASDSAESDGAVAPFRVQGFRGGGS